MNFNEQPIFEKPPSFFASKIERKGSVIERCNSWIGE